MRPACYHSSSFSFQRLFCSPPPCSEIDSEEVLRLTDGSELELQKREGRRRSTRVRKSNGSDTWLLDLSDEDENHEIRESHVNDGNIVKKSGPQKKRSRYSLVHYHKRMIYIYNFFGS